MNYDAILAIISCFKDKITFQEPKTIIKKELPDDIKEWYLNGKKENDIKEANKNNYLFSIKETSSKELCIYYPSPRDIDFRIITDTPPQDIQFNKEIKDNREKLIKETIYNHLDTILSDIEIMPFNVKKLEDKSAYECRIKGKDNELIKIDYDETKQSINLKMRNKDKYLKLSLNNYIESTRYDGMITIEKPSLKRNWLIKNLFKKKSKLELKNKEKADFISITKDEIKSSLEASGTTYAVEGLYIYEIKENKFTLNYYDQETITTILSTNFNKRLELNNIVKTLKEKKELSNTSFKEKLEEYGLLPSASFTIEGMTKELEILINKSYTNPKLLLQDLYKIKQ